MATGLLQGPICRPLACHKDHYRPLATTRTTQQTTCHHKNHSTDHWLNTGPWNHNGQMSGDHVNGNGTEEPVDTTAAVTHSEHFQTLLEAGLPQKVAEKLDEIYVAGLVVHCELDERAIEALKIFSEEGALQVLVKFKESDLSHVTNKSAFLCGVMKTYRNPEKRKKRKIKRQAAAKVAAKVQMSTIPLIDDYREWVSSTQLYDDYYYYGPPPHMPPPARDQRGGGRGGYNYPPDYNGYEDYYDYHGYDYHNYCGGYDDFQAPSRGQGGDRGSRGASPARGHGGVGAPRGRAGFSQRGGSGPSRDTRGARGGVQPRGHGGVRGARCGRGGNVGGKRKADGYNQPDSKRRQTNNQNWGS